MNCSNDNLQDYIETTINTHEREHRTDCNVNRLHEKKHLLKIWVAHSLVKVIGYDNVFDQKTIAGFPYEKVRQFMVEHGNNIDLLFGCNSKNWKNLELIDIHTEWNKDKIKEAQNENKEMKKLMTEYINSRLRSVCNIGVKNKYKGGKAIKREEYIIQGLDIWETGGVKILNNTKADLLHLNKNFKRLMTKTKVKPMMWKCVSELVAIESK
jgi:hypothetical protein